MGSHLQQGSYRGLDRLLGRDVSEGGHWEEDRDWFVVGWVVERGSLQSPKSSSDQDVTVNLNPKTQGVLPFREQALNPPLKSLACLRPESAPSLSTSSDQRQSIPTMCDQ